MTAIGIAGVAAVVSYRHAFDVVTDHGEPRATAALVPLCVDGLVYAAGMVHLDSARRGQKAGWLAWLALGLGIGATIAVNVLHGIEAGPVGAVVAAWPAVTLVLVVELLMGMIRRVRRVAPGDAQDDATATDTRHDTDGDTSDATRVTVGDIGSDTERDTDGAMTRDIGGDTPRAIEAAPSRRRRTATRRTTRSVSRDTAPVSAEDRMARAREVLASEPDISGAELGRRLGLSPRQGQRLLADVRSADPLPGQLAIENDAHDATADRDTNDDKNDTTQDDVAADVVRLSVVGER